MLNRRKMIQALSAALVVPGGVPGGVPVSVRPDAAVVPAYFSPEFYPGAWDQLADPRLYAVVLNIASGPGLVPDPLFAGAVRRIEDLGGTVTGYVDVGYGSRPAEVIDLEARRYRQWYGVADVFFDQVPAGPAGLPYMQQVTELVRGRGAEFVVFNHGTYPDAAYDTLADLLVTFEGPLSAYTAAQPPAWTLQGPGKRFCALVYGVSAGDLDSVLALAGQRNTGVVFVTDRSGVNPYDELPSYFPKLVAL
ncbi:MAG: spherulation-specific family 4 protein [Streptosporangiaceae bacterium]